MQYLLWRLKYNINFNYRCRYLQAIRFLAKQRINKQRPYELLEVGSGDAGIGYFFPDYKNLAVDICFGKGYLANQKKIAASLDTLPFKNNSFNFVMSVDTFEHISRERRISAIGEMLRVSRKFLIITIPCSRLAQDYEAKLLQKFELVSISPPSWLLEHRHNQLPTENEILSLIKSECRSYQIQNIEILPSGNIRFWYIANTALVFGKAIYLITNLAFSMFSIVSDRLLTLSPSYRKTYIIEIDKRQ
jgi:hypothetical protein